MVFQQQPSVKRATIKHTGNLHGFGLSMISIINIQVLDMNVKWVVVIIIFALNTIDLGQMNAY